MTLDEIKDPRLRERIQSQIDQEDAARRPHQPVGGLGNTERQQNPLPPLVPGPKTLRGCKGRVAVVVTIVRAGRKLLDEDNLISGAKPLRDSVARSLALDDADPRITWEYRQHITKGKPGTQILITAL